ncbi:FimV/HubP family polar landmark protein [Undibacterium fentianense]|uniref:Tfp pilus assembly protein FimV n=1 Tax=Undibacterium fentianense TaxID=2828728 RepID=A0A941E4U8_9BURK|nr:FimV/HubP family polar landmark protein [Undibacterium fentianense]MBR7801202.1 hypothetical protein [Undibacterium fentianense]
MNFIASSARAAFIGLICLALQSSMLVHAKQQADMQANSNQSDVTSQTAKQIQQEKLQQELRNLLAENKRINHEKIQVLEAQSKRVFWTKLLIGFLSLALLAALVSFWRLHVQHKIQDGIETLTTSLRHFQDSLFTLSFIDTSQLSTVGGISSFDLDLDDTHSQQANSTIHGFQRTSSKHAVIARDEFSDIRGFVDAWLNVYKPGDPRYEQAQAAASKPSSPKSWLQMLESLRQNNDQIGFESLRKEIKKFFNLKVMPWNASNDVQHQNLYDYPHIVQKIFECWHTNDITVYLERLLNNSRLSPREGFDLHIFQQLEELLSLVNSDNRPKTVSDLKSHPIAEYLIHPDQRGKRTYVSQQNKDTATSTIDSSLAAQFNSPTSIAATSNATGPLSVSKQDELLTPKVSTAALANANTASDYTVRLDHVSRANANQVRIQLASAYLEMADSEGACLLLEDVIREAGPEQQAQARQLLAEIEAKRAAQDITIRHHSGY